MRGGEGREKGEGHTWADFPPARARGVGADGFGRGRISLHDPQWPAAGRLPADFRETRGAGIPTGRQGLRSGGAAEGLRAAVPAGDAPRPHLLCRASCRCRTTLLLAHPVGSTLQAAGSVESAFKSRMVEKRAEDHGIRMSRQRAES